MLWVSLSVVTAMVLYFSLRHHFSSGEEHQLSLGVATPSSSNSLSWFPFLLRHLESSPDASWTDFRASSSSAAASALAASRRLAASDPAGASRLAARAWALSLAAGAPLEEAAPSDADWYGPPTPAPQGQTRGCPVFPPGDAEEEKGAKKGVEEYSVPVSYSIVVPVHEASSESLLTTLGQLADSMAAQSMWRRERGNPVVTGELWMVEDGSNNQAATAALLTQWMEKEAPRLASHNVSLHLALLPENVGAGAARNAGLWRSRGDVVIFADADDTYYLPYVDVLFSGLEQCRRCSRAGGATDVEGLSGVSSEWMAVLQQGFASFGFRREALEWVGGFPSTSIYEDVWLQQALAPLFVSLSEVPVRAYRWRPGNHLDHQKSRFRVASTSASSSSSSFRLGHLHHDGPAARLAALDGLLGRRWFARAFLPRLAAARRRCAAGLPPPPFPAPPPRLARHLPAPPSLPGEGLGHGTWAGQLLPDRPLFPPSSGSYSSTSSSSPPRSALFAPGPRHPYGPSQDAARLSRPPCGAWFAVLANPDVVVFPCGEHPGSARARWPNATLVYLCARPALFPWVDERLFDRRVNTPCEAL